MKTIKLILSLDGIEFAQNVDLQFVLFQQDRCLFPDGFSHIYW